MLFQGRSMYILKLPPVLVTEMGIPNFVKKAKKARLTSVWVKVAEGGADYSNIIGDSNRSLYRELAVNLGKL